jgi:hypothetical protein
MATTSTSDTDMKDVKWFELGKDYVRSSENAASNRRALADCSRESGA